MSPNGCKASTEPALPPSESLSTSQQLAAYGRVLLRHVHDVGVFLDRKTLVRDGLLHGRIGLADKALLVGGGRLGDLVAIALAYGRHVFDGGGSGIDLLVGNVRGRCRAGRR